MVDAGADLRQLEAGQQPLAALEFSKCSVPDRRTRGLSLLTIRLCNNGQRSELAFQSDSFDTNLVSRQLQISFPLAPFIPFVHFLETYLIFVYSCRLRVH